MSCENPCGVSETNTAACESTPSVVENFVRHFFGTVTKTEVDGAVEWTLPCELDTGLPANPRLEGEGLACYFLRLFHDGIVGLTGPAGPAGADGADGQPGYTVTLTSFTQPSGASPFISVRFAHHPAFVAGQTIYIENSGYYTINSVGADDTYLLTLVGLAPGAPTGVIPAGQMVAISGPRGATGPTGPQGPQGIQGPPGPAGESFAREWEYVAGVTSSNYSCTATMSDIVFTDTNPRIVIEHAGTYLVVGAATAYKTGAGAPGDLCAIRVHNATLGVNVANAYGAIYYANANSTHQIFCMAITDIASDNTELRLRARSSTAGLYEITDTCTFLMAIRLD